MERLCFSPARARVWTLLLAGCFAVIQVGCEDASQQASRKSTLGPVGPEESFQRILARLKRRLEQGPRQVFSSGLDADSNETSSFSLKDTVTGVVLPPEQEGEPYRAQVTVRTHADYVFTRTVPEPILEEPKDENGVDSVLSLLEQGGEGAEADDPFLSPESSLSEDSLGRPSSDETTARNAKPGTQTIPDSFDDVNRYLLIYKNGRWALEEPIEEDEEALKLIFDYALEGQ